jgi:hypothetical protein
MDTAGPCLEGAERDSAVHFTGVAKSDGTASRLFRVFTLACQVLPALRSQHNGLRCPPSTHSSGHRERMTTRASKSPRTPGKSSGCRHQEPHAHRNSSTAYNHLFADFRSFVLPPNFPRMPRIHGLHGNLKSRSFDVIGRM